MVPFTVVPAEPFTAVPDPSSSAQRATRPLCGAVIWAFAVPWVWAGERATFQIRTASRTPSRKRGVVVPYARLELASAAAWMLCAWTGCPGDGVAHRAP